MASNKDIIFKFRKKEWKVQKDPYCYAVHYKNGENWSLVGYYTSTKELIQRLIRENLINGNDGREFLKDMKGVCEELGEVVRKAFK